MSLLQRLLAKSDQNIHSNQHCMYIYIFNYYFFFFFLKGEPGAAKRPMGKLIKCDALWKVCSRKTKRGVPPHLLLGNTGL